MAFQHDSCKLLALTGTCQHICQQGKQAKARCPSIRRLITNMPCNFDKALCSWNADCICAVFCWTFCPTDIAKAASPRKVRWAIEHRPSYSLAQATTFENGLLLLLKKPIVLQTCNVPYSQKPCSSCNQQCSWACCSSHHEQQQYGHLQPAAFCFL